MVVCLTVAVFGTAVQAAETVLFHDSIGGYDSEPYSDANAAVVCTQGNKAHQWLKTSWTYGGAAGRGQDYAVTPPDQFCYLNSGNTGVYSTIAVPLATPSTTRYGQVIVTVGATADWIARLAVCDTTTPQFPDAYGEYANTGVDFVWNTGAAENSYFSDHDLNGTASMYSISGYRTYEFQKITINYDLLLDKYSVYINNSLVVDNVNFSHQLATISSIAIGGAYWTSGHMAVLDAWQWTVDDTTAYTSAGAYIPEPATITMLGVGGLLVMCRRLRLRRGK